MKRRRKKRKTNTLFQFIGGVLRNPVVQRTALLLFCFVVTVNFIVSMLGASGIYLFSPFHMWNKSRAIGFYVSHQILQVGKPTPPSAKWALLQAVKKHNVPTNLVFAIAKVESDFVSNRVSRTGAMGLMQIMPDTAEDLGVQDPFHPVDSANAGTRYISRLWRKYRGDIRRVAAAYNYGPGRVPKIGNYYIPKETEIYVRRVVRYSQTMTL